MKPNFASRLWAHSSFATRLLVSTGFALVVAGLALLYFSTRKDADLVRADLADQAVYELEPLLPALARPAATDNGALIHQILTARVRQPNIESITWTNSAGKSVTAGKPEIRSSAPTWFRDWLKLEPVSCTRTVSAGERLIGTVTIVISPAPDENRLWSEFRNDVTVLVLGMGLAFLGILLILRTGLRPLRELSRAAVRLGGGEFSASIPVRGSPEIRSVVTAFNQMAADIPALIARVEEQRAALRTSEEIFRATFEQAAVGMAHVATNGRWIRINRKLCDIVGYSEKELLARTFQDITHADDLEADIRAVQRMLAGETDSYSVEKRYLRKGGDVVWVNLKAALRRNAAGEPDYFITVIEDISARKRAEAALRESEARFKLLFDKHDAAMLLIEPASGDIVAANPSAERFYGYPLEQLRRMKIQDINILAPEDVEAERRRAESEERNYFVFPHRLASGEVRIVEVHSSPIEFQGMALLFSIIHDVTARNAAEAALRESEAYNKVLFADSRIALMVLDPVTGRFTDCNDAAVRIHGARGRNDLIGKSLADFSPAVQYDGADSATAARERIERAISQGAHLFEWRHRRPDGETWDAEVHLMTFRHRDRLMLQLSLQDVSAHRKADERLRLDASVFASTHDGVIITDPQGTILEVNNAFVTLTGYTREQVIGRNPRVLSSGRQDRAFYEAMWRSLLHQGVWQGEIYNRKANGELIAEMLVINAVRDAEGRLTHYVGVFSDITQFKENQLQLEYMAHYDPLTRLPNRILLADRMNQALVQAQRQQSLVAVCYLDLDGFKPINDTHGHQTGDRLLVEIAGRLKAAVRSGDTVTRLGGDEFVLLLTNLASVQELEAVLARILASVAEPARVGELLRVSASIGITLYPIDGSDPDTLLRHADQAMYVAKDAGGSTYHIFNPDQDRRARGHRETLASVRRALSRREFRLHYQPKVDLRQGRVVGAEALIRWQHPERGLVAPAQFLPAIEGTDLAVEVHHWVLQEALRQMAAWSRHGLQLPVSVNVSARLLLLPGLDAWLKAQLAEFPSVAPHWLELEILETAALDDLLRVSETMSACQRLGVSFAIDDFGTGYSSLTYLKRLPAQVLKIDRSFVANMLADPEDLAIVEGVMALAAAFGRKVVAEGVEAPAHAQLLIQMGCHIAQGFGIAPPMTAAELASWISQFRLGDEWISPDPQGLPRDPL